MCIFKASYQGGHNESSLRLGDVYEVKQMIPKGNGKIMLQIEGLEGEYDDSLFHRLENKGFHYSVGDKIPVVGNRMRLVKRKHDVEEFMTGEVKLIEKSRIPGAYLVYTDKAVYEVSPM